MELPAIAVPARPGHLLLPEPLVEPGHPSFLVTTLVYTYVALAAYNTEILTLPLENVETIVDEAANVAAVDARGRPKTDVAGGRRRTEREKDGRDDRTAGRARGPNWRSMWNEGTDAVMDVPLAGVCEVLYGGGMVDYVF